MREIEKTINQCVEGHCNQGCSRVSGFTTGLKAGQAFSEVAGLSRLERQQVLDERVSIMAVYDAVYGP